MVIVRTRHTNSSKWYKHKNKLYYKKARTSAVGLNGSELVPFELFDIMVVRS